MSSENIYYEIIVRDILGDRHRHLTQFLPSDDDEYEEGWLVIDIDEFETVRYNMDKIISWSYREIDLTDDIPTVAETVEAVRDGK
jgi:hypothetical protein